LKDFSQENKAKILDLKSLYIEPSAKTPQIDLNHLSGELIFSGRSIPENAALLYENILKWTKEYAVNPRPTTNLRLNLEYFNTASAIWLAKIVQAICNIENRENTLIIHSYFSIQDFDNFNTDDILDELYPLINLVGTTNISVGIKIYGTDEKGEIIKESMLFI